MLIFAGLIFNIAISSTEKRIKCFHRIRRRRFFVASVPELKGCHTQARTLEELHERIEEVIELFPEV